MNKKITWGIIALVAVLIIAGIVFTVDREESINSESEQGIEDEQGIMDLGEEGDLLWEVEDELFYAYDLIYEMEEDLTNEEYGELISRYEELEQDLWDIEDAYYEEELSKEEFEEELNNLLEEVESFVSELEA